LVEVIVAGLGLLTAMFGAARWLIHVYWKQAETIENLRRKHDREQLRSIDDKIKDMAQDIFAHTTTMNKLEARLVHLTKRVEDSAVCSEKAFFDFASFMAASEKRTEKLESQIVQLAKGMMLIKKSNGGKSSD